MRRRARGPTPDDAWLADGAGARGTRYRRDSVALGIPGRLYVLFGALS
jgi:hypothetical protein